MTASSTMQEAFEAEIGVITADTGLYLVVARGDGAAMNQALTSVGAITAARISSTRVLAVMRYSSFESMRTHRAIRLIGPVSLDPERFEHFQRIVGVNTADE